MGWREQSNLKEVKTFIHRDISCSIFPSPTGTLQDKWPSHSRSRANVYFLATPQHSIHLIYIRKSFWLQTCGVWWSNPKMFQRRLAYRVVESPKDYVQFSTTSFDKIHNIKQLLVNSTLPSKAYVYMIVFICFESLCAVYLWNFWIGRSNDTNDCQKFWSIRQKIKRAWRWNKKWSTP